jgi:enamine deaminase RidA (YjgF/YER057c/UK114 family)
MDKSQEKQIHAETSPGKRAYQQGPKPEKTPLYSPAVSYGNLLFLAGKVARIPGDIKAHADYVLNEIEKELKNAGSSMEKVLKVNVYLNDIKDFAAFNEVYLGRFGDEPPVRTTVAPMGGLPGETTVEIDCIAYI